MLSLAPRFDLFRILLPKDYFPKEVLDKYDNILSRNQGVLTSSINYLNESISGISFPGIQDLIQEQDQVGHNTMKQIPGIGGKINIEPHHIHSSMNSGNPLSKIENEFTISFRRNQGLFNYWMLYETIFYRYVKPELFGKYNDNFTLFILNELGEPVIKVLLMQPEISGIDGLEFSYDKIERQKETFDVTFRFNNIDMDFCVD